jgi:hypothetical protein
VEESMRRKAIFIAMLMLIFITGNHASAEQVQLLQNTGFESWAKHGPGGPPDHWDNITSSFTSMQDLATVHSGTYSVKLNWGVSTRQDIGYDLIPVYGDSVYTCTLWVYDNDASSRIRMWFSYDNGYNGPSEYSINFAGWIAYVYQSTAPPGAKTLQLQVRMYQQTSAVHTIYIDDVTLWGPGGPYPDTVAIADIQNVTFPGYSPDCYPANYLGEYMSVTGVVVARKEASTRRNSFFIQDADALWSGIYIYAAPETVSVGDNVTICGIPVEYEGETEFGTIFGQTRNSSGNPLPSTRIVNCAELSSDSCQVTAEPYEGMFIQINNVMITSVAANNDYWANDGSGDSCIVTNDIYYQGSNPPTISLNETYSYIKGVCHYIYGGYTIAPRYASDVARPTFRFSQLDYIFESGSAINTPWARLDLTYMGSPKIKYLNLNVNNSWRIQNIPLPSFAGNGVLQTMPICFPITDTSGGLIRINYGYRLSDTLLTVMPPQLKQDTVYSDSILYSRGYGDSTYLSIIPVTPLIGGLVKDSTAITMTDFPNQDCYRYESVPAASSNNALYINQIRGLGIDPDALSITHMKEIVGFVPNSGSPNWVNNKRQNMRARNLPLESTIIYDMSKIKDFLADKNDITIDVEHLVGGRPMIHSMAIVAIKELADSNYVLYVAHDTKQGMGYGGAITEIVTYDHNTGLFNGGSGLAGGAYLVQIVIEGPIRRDAVEVSNPTKYRNLNGYTPGSGDPSNSAWQVIYTDYNVIRTIQTWSDNGDGKLSAGDTLAVRDSLTHNIMAAHVTDVYPILTVMNLHGETAHLEYFINNANIDPIANVHGSYWREIYPNYEAMQFCQDWQDNGNGILGADDSLLLMAISGPDSGLVDTFGVIDVATGMTTILGCTYFLGDINGDGQRLGADVTYGVRYFKGTGPQPPDSCYLDSASTYLYVAADVNGNCEFRGSDITRLVAYFKSTGTLSYCHFFPQAP